MTRPPYSLFNLCGLSSCRVGGAGRAAIERYKKEGKRSKQKKEIRNVRQGFLPKCGGVYLFVVLSQVIYIIVND